MRPTPTPCPSSRILIVDGDDGVYGHLMANALDRAGYTDSRRVETAHEALEAVREEQPRMVVLEDLPRGGVGVRGMSRAEETGSEISCRVVFVSAERGRAP